MVMLNPEEEAALKRGNRVVFEEPALNKLTRDIVPPAVRISIPLDNRYRLRAVAKILAGLATRLEALTHLADTREQTILVEACMEARITNHRIRACKIGPQRKPENETF